jgi:CRP-like cAMP-binding protein
MDLQDAREIVLNLLSPGDMFGQVAVFDQGTRSATVTALKPSSLLAYPHDRLLLVLHEHPSIAIKLLGSMARLVRQLTARAGNLTELPIQLRVARKLLEIAELLGTLVMPNQLALPALVTQQHLANHVQATRESVNRSLSTLVKQGLLQQTKTQLVILDCAGLTRIAGMSTRDLQPTTRNKPTAE